MKSEPNQPKMHPPLRQAQTQRIGVYHRVSTIDQDPTLADRELEHYAAHLGGAVTMQIRETGSGANNCRPGLQKLMDAARRGKLDVVLVWKLDRFGRSALDLLANVQALADAGVRFVAITQGIDVKPYGDAMSRLLLTMLAAVAEFERDLIRERTRLGLEKARADGKQLGRPRKDWPSPAEVRRLRDSGASWSKCAAELNCTVAMARRRFEEQQS